MKILMIAAACLLTQLAANSQGPVDIRQNNQQARIIQGEQNGSLTPMEARNLERQQMRINQAEHQAAADGVITPRERRRIERMKNRASRNIYRKKHNFINQ